LIDQVDEDLIRLESGEKDDELVNRIFRCFHTIKGTTGFLNFKDCNELAHSAENILNDMRNDELDPTPEIIDVLLETIDWFKGFVTDVEDREEKEYNISELVGSIKDILNNAPSKVATTNNKNTAESNNRSLNFPEELIDEFVSEATELLDTLDNEIIVLELEVDDEDYINEIFRAFHTLKGNSGLMGFASMSNIAHKSEDLLGLLRDKEVKPSSDIVDVLLHSIDFMRKVVGEVENNCVKTHDISDLEQKLLSLSGVKTSNQDMLPVKQKPTKKAGTKKVKVAKRRVEQTIRVDVDRLNKLMNQAGELVLEKNRLIQISQKLKQMYAGVSEISDLDSLNNSLGMVTTEIQESVMQMRMLPIANVFRKFPRLIRDLAKEKNKKIELVISGEETELDRTVIESIGDPLVHLLRNAIDHGLEDGPTRLKAGKSEIGKIFLSACQEGNHVVVELRDDGAGIEPEVISSKALEKGMITEEELSLMSTRDIINLIFKPGFSTAKEITDVSGRGVGMDVVYSNISKLNGSVDILSKVGEGTNFKIKIPLTLTIQSGMVVKVCDETYILPLTNILETINLTDGLIKTIQGSEMIEFRNSVLPIIRLSDWFSVPHSDEPQNEFVIIISIVEKRLGLVVTELIGQEETVVKPLGESLGKVLGIAGATIRGDGNISLIIDTVELLENSRPHVGQN
jgi:two-component system chemotaxis sensor kinase CheA